MGYGADLRPEAVKHYWGSGDTCAETGKIFGADGSSAQRRVQQYEEKGDLSDKPLKRGFKKIDPAKLRAYAKEHPDATQREIADEFRCSNQAVGKALKRPAVTRKKNAPPQRTERRGSEGVSGNIGAFFRRKALLRGRIRLSELL